jgi:hypothetical protein
MTAEGRQLVFVDGYSGPQHGCILVGSPIEANTQQGCRIES